MSSEALWRTAPSLFRWCSKNMCNRSLSRAPPAAVAIWAATVHHCGPGAGRIRLRARNGILFIGCQGCKGPRCSLNSSFQSPRENPYKMNQTTNLKSHTGSGWLGIYTLTSPRRLQVSAGFNAFTGCFSLKPHGIKTEGKHKIKSPMLFIGNCPWCSCECQIQQR